MPGRLIVRRIPDFAADKHRAAGQDGLFDVWRFHAFFTTTDPKVLDTVSADKTHRHHAIIEQVHADLKGSALAHLPSGVFTANTAWLVLAVIAFNLTRAAAALAAPTGSDLARATTATVRRTLIQIPARIATRARRVILHLPQDWPWETAWTRLNDRVAARPDTPPRPPTLSHSDSGPRSTTHTDRWIEAKTMPGRDIRASAGPCFRSCPPPACISQIWTCIPTPCPTFPGVTSGRRSHFGWRVPCRNDAATREEVLDIANSVVATAGTTRLAPAGCPQSATTRYASSVPAGRCHGTAR